MCYSFSVNLVPLILVLELFLKVGCPNYDSYPDAQKVANDFQNGKYDDAMDELSGKKKPQNANAGPAQGNQPWEDWVRDMMKPKTQENNPYFRDPDKANPVTPNASPEQRQPEGQEDYPYQGNPRPRKGGAGDAGDDDEEGPGKDQGLKTRGDDDDETDTKDDDPDGSRRKKKKGDEDEDDEEEDGDDDDDDRKKKKGDDDDDEEDETEDKDDGKGGKRRKGADDDEEEEDEDGAGAGDDDEKRPKVPYVVPPKMPKRKIKKVYLPLGEILKRARLYGTNAAFYPYKSKHPHMYRQYLRAQRRRGGGGGGGGGGRRRRPSARRGSRGRSRSRSPRGG